MVRSGSSKVVDAPGLATSFLGEGLSQNSRSSQASDREPLGRLCEHGEQLCQSSSITLTHMVKVTFSPAKRFEGASVEPNRARVEAQVVFRVSPRTPQIHPEGALTSML